MPTGWVAAPDEAVLNQVAATLNSTQRSGVVLAGPDGVGKTLVARVAAQRFVAQQPTTVVRWVARTAPERNLPFSAFGRLLES
ncbi:MAG: hypothetical protein J2P17_02530 [Mycobacterium sp.]|nr:hypothetical protein [Mycobacterium sp.]